MMRVEFISRLAWLLYGFLVVSYVSGRDGNEQLAGCNEKWVEFKRHYVKSYPNAFEHDRRRDIFCKNLQFAWDKNAELGSNDAFGINHMSDWTKEELGSLIMRTPMTVEKFNFRSINITKFLESIKFKNDKLPDQLDYSRDPRIVGPAKHQGNCGSCWAFATTGLLEANEHKWNPSISRITPLSEQQLVDCMNGDGCRGRHNIDALKYIKSVGGLEAEKDYKYVSGRNQSNHKCRFDPTKIYPPTRNLKSFKRLYGSSEDDLKKLVATYGPVLVNAIFMPDIFLLKNGIYKNSNCNDRFQNHAVLVVGYGTSAQGEDYWIVKNSWGKDWAVNGFGKMARNRNNQCHIATWPHILV